MADQDTSSRPWWTSATKAPTSRHPSEKLKVKSSLNSLASALGFKPKKSPTLTIEDPPLPIQRPPANEYATASTRLVGNRPPSKSISSTVSRAESSEPRTPSDHNHNTARHSLLTLSDTDPFAPRGIVTIASPTDPTRLSAYSNHSGPDVAQVKIEDRMSYASSSSLSHSHGSPADYSPSKKAVSPTSPSDSLPSRRLFKRPSESNLIRSYSYNPSDTSVRPPPVQPTLHKSPSSATLMSAGRPSTRPNMRPRGLTDNGLVQKAGFFVQASPKPAPHPPSALPTSSSSSLSKPLSPRVIVRQASAQRLNQPAAPPPRTGLPAPPSHSPRLDTGTGPYHPSHSTTSSTISFTSSVSSVEALQPISPANAPERPRRTSNRSIFSTDTGKSPVAERPSQNLASPPLSLKKALSQQSLRRRVSPSTTGTSTPESEKTPSKRGFPHPRIPLPPLPSLSLRPSSNNAPTTPGETSQDKRVSTASSTGGRRRRLFSGGSSRRPSTSHSTKGDDDAQSLFSLKSEQDIYIHPSFFKPWMSPHVPTSPSQWEDANPETAPNSPVKAQGAFSSQQQQNQMSPKAPALTLSPFRKGEISLPRARGLSIRSSDTVFSDGDPDQPIRGVEPTRPFQRSNTLSPGTKNELSRRPTDIGRPSTAQTPYQSRAEPDVPLEVAVPDPIEQTFTPSSSPPPVVIRSLPPPPRRPRPAPKPEPDSAPVVTPSPAAIPAPAKPAAAVPTRPSRMRSKTNKSMEKIMHRRSIMRKPSFLDIDDESEDERSHIPPGSDIGDSFIDFARESFDTIRSDD